MGGEAGALKKRSFLKPLWSSETSIQEKRWEWGLMWEKDREGKPIKETEWRDRKMQELMSEESERLCRWEIGKKKREERTMGTGRGRGVGKTARWREVAPSIAPSAQRQCRGERRAWLLVATHRATVTRGALLLPACLPLYIQ